MKKITLIIISLICIYIIGNLINQTWNQSPSNYDGYIDYSNEFYSIKIPNYLEIQDYEISNKTIKYGNDLILRTVFQETGLNDKFKNGINIFPIKNSIDINLIDGTSKMISINDIQNINSKKLNQIDNALTLSVFKEAMRASNNREIDVHRVDNLEVRKTIQGLYYLTESYSIEGNKMTLVFIPLNKHMLNISYTYSDDNNPDFEKSINSLILNQDL